MSVRQMFRRVVEDLMPLAEGKPIDLGLVGEGDAQIVADEMGLKALVKNLLENAIRRTTRWLR